MGRTTSSIVHHKRSKKVLKDAKGFIGSRSKLFRTAKDARRRALQNSYKDRKRKKRDFRLLWIVRINAAARICDISYSRLINGLNGAGITLNRKMLAEIAVNDMNAFSKIVEKIKGK